MNYEIIRPTKKQLEANHREYLICYGNGGFAGHRVWKLGDIYRIVNHGWICAQHLCEGKLEKVVEIMDWKRHRESGHG